MKFDNMPTAQAKPSDALAMVAAIDRLISEGINVRRPIGSTFQLKLPDGLSYYPTTGKIYRDSAPAAYQQTGLAALLAVLHSPMTNSA